MLFIAGTTAIVCSMSLRLIHSMFCINFTYIPLLPLCYVYKPITVIDSSDLTRFERFRELHITILKDTHLSYPLFD